MHIFYRERGRSFRLEGDVVGAGVYELELQGAGEALSRVLGGLKPEDGKLYKIVEINP